MRNIIKRYLFRSGLFSGIYRKWFCKSAGEWADYLRVHGGLVAIGVDCEINKDVTITDPYLVRIGAHVTLSTCSLISHDGSIKQVRNATGKAVDAVGKIDIRDNCFIGFGSIVLRNCTIGPNSIVAAGAVVTADVPPDSVYAGVPARRICSMSEFADRLFAETESLPWSTMIRDRDGAFDAAIEPELKARRIKWFWHNR